MIEEKKEPTGTGILVSNAVYPEADAVFTAHAKPLQDITNDAIVVLDTNSLLVPYSIGKTSLAQIRKTYQALISKKRLIIPGQVAREFAKNRAARLAELFQQLNRKKSQASISRGKYPLLESVANYQASIDLEEQLDKLLEEYKKSIDKIMECIQDWTWNDPVSLLYRELFSKEIVFDPAFHEKELKEDLDYRNSHKIPPGYKDAGKDDSGVGDLLIWKTILVIGKERKENLLLVSGEEKPDWWHRSEGRPL